MTKLRDYRDYDQLKVAFGEHGDFLSNYSSYAETGVARAEALAFCDEMDPDFGGGLSRHEALYVVDKYVCWYDFQGMLANFDWIAWIFKPPKETNVIDISGDTSYWRWVLEEELGKGGEAPDDAQAFWLAMGPLIGHDLSRDQVLTIIDRFISWADEAGFFGGTLWRRRSL